MWRMNSSRFCAPLSLLWLVTGCPSTQVGPASDGITDAADVADVADVAPADTDAGPDTDSSTDVSGPPVNIYSPANGCFTIHAQGESSSLQLAVNPASDGYVFDSDGGGEPARFHFRAADLGTYLLYDTDRAFVVATSTAGTWSLKRPTKLQSAVELLDDTFQSPAEWDLQASAADPSRYQMRHHASGGYLTTQPGVLTTDVAAAAILTLNAETGCADFPELTLDATGTVTPRNWDDGDVYGIAEIHSHLNTNSGFGGGGVFHGAPFHRLGVEHALADCDVHHGEDGKNDIVGFFYDGSASFDLDALLPIITSGEVADFNHFTAGYPGFVDWPNSWNKSTHQTMYYRWLQRAYMSGLRLMVELATSNSVLCELVLATNAQGVRYSCNDMVNVQRSIEQVRAMERYIDAQSGGPGEGWFRVVETPAQAREVVNAGKLAVVLGIEVSNLFDCFSTPKAGFDVCTPESVTGTLDYYEALGIRALFPVHKYDNGFTAGDGSSGIIELGNMLNSGHYSNFVEDCPDIETTFDGGHVTFGGLNQPRDDYFAPPVLDLQGWEDNLLATLLPFVDDITSPPLDGNWCQKHGMTPLGESLLQELMDRGILIDIGHLPKRALVRAYEMLEAVDYPATKTHGSGNKGRLYGLGGMRGSGLGRCSNPADPGGMLNGLKADVAARVAAGQYPSEGLSFDLNGFAGGPRPRFGPNSPCGPDQANPVNYPFTSYDGKVTFEAPQLGSRAVDFNTEGMIHIGLLPELIEDVRRDGATDEALEPLFRSAEAYIRMWEKATSKATR